MKTTDPKRRWYQFTLRHLLVAVLLLSLPLAWIGHRYRQGQVAEATVRKLGGSASRWWHWDWRWGQVKIARFKGADIHDADLKRIAAIRTLGSLDLSKTEITDEGLAHLKGLRRLSSLDLSDTQITDAGLETLRDLPALRLLQAHRTGITDAGVEKLERESPEVDVYYTAK